MFFITYLSTGETLFNRQVENQIDNLFASSENISNKLFNYDQITNNLPKPVQRYFKCALENGQQYISYLQVKHGGTFRLSEGQQWMSIERKEYFTTESPGFLWLGKIKPFPLLWMTGIDQYILGKGFFQIKLFSAFTVGNATKGKELNDDELVRWLAEAPLFPTALIPSKNFQWEQIDSNSAKAIVKDRELTVDVIFHFNEKGKNVQTTADRYRAVDNSYSKDKRVGYYRDDKQSII